MYQPRYQLLEVDDDNGCRGSMFQNFSGGGEAMILIHNNILTRVKLKSCYHHPEKLQSSCLHSCWRCSKEIFVNMPTHQFLALLGVLRQPVYTSPRCYDNAHLLCSRVPHQHVGCRDWRNNVTIGRLYPLMTMVWHTEVPLEMTVYQSR